MQILLNTDSNVDGRHAMADHLDHVVSDAIGHFAGQVTRVEAHVTDADGATRTGPEGIHCTLEARLAHQPSIVVKDHAANAHQAINGAVGKLKRAVSSALETHHRRHDNAASNTAEGDSLSPD